MDTRTGRTNLTRSQDQSLESHVIGRMLPAPCYTTHMDEARLDQLKAHAEKAITLWHVAQQTGQQPDPRHRDWWMGYLEAVRDMRSGSAPWPAEFGLEART
jgi:hypothetical protein